MTTDELFDKIYNILKEKGKIPDIIDYGSSARYKSKPITTYEFSLTTNLCYGGNEGIYASFRIEYEKNKELFRDELGTFKTLCTDDESMHIMSNLLADFVIEENKYVSEHLDEFSWEGADVYAINDAGEKLKWGYACRSMERALKKKDELLEKYPKVWVRDNATRKEKIYKSDRERENIEEVERER